MIRLFITCLIIIMAAYNLPVPSLAQQSGLNIQFSPNPADLKINEEKIIKITLSSTEGISAFDLKFQSTGPLQITDFIDNIGSDNNFNPFNAKQINESTQGSRSRLAYVFTAASPDLPKTVEIFAKILASSEGQGKIELDYNNSQVTGAKGQALVLLPASADYNLNPTQSSPAFTDPSSIRANFPATAAIVNLKLRLYGAQVSNRKIKAIAVAVGRVGGGKFESERREFDLNFASDGTLSGTVAFPDFRDGNKYSLMIKVDKYLLRRICDTIPTEARTGGYRCKNPTLTIRQGENNFDFSGIALVPGDLGLADGVLNGYDLSLVRNNLGNKDALPMADLNYDGVVDVKDFEIIQYVAKNTTGRADQ